jgi:integrative and conjugative element protein (TIGR02256 family)
VSGFVVAVKSGRVLVDGRLHEIIAGVTGWDDQCPELRDPEVAALFGKSPGLHASAGRSLERTRARSSNVTTLPPPPKQAPSRSSKTHGRPKLREGEPRLTVALSGSARRTIEDEFYAVTRAGGVETGGWLYGERGRTWKRTIAVAIARPPGRGAVHGPHSFSPSGDYQQEEQGFARIGADHLCRVGDWHSHPSKGAEPSDGDLDVWTNCFLVANEKRGVAYYVGLIAALDDSRGFARMRLGAFCLSYDSFGRVIYEPASIA